MHQVARLVRSARKDNDYSRRLDQVASLTALPAASQTVPHRPMPFPSDRPAGFKSQTFPADGNVPCQTTAARQRSSVIFGSEGAKTGTKNFPGTSKNLKRQTARHSFLDGTAHSPARARSKAWKVSQNSSHSADLRPNRFVVGDARIVDHPRTRWP